MCLLSWWGDSVKKYPINTNMTTGLLLFVMLGAFLNTIALPTESTNSLFLSQPSVKEIMYFRSNLEIACLATRVNMD